MQPSMQTQKFWPIAALCIAAYAASMAHAEQASPPPQNLEKLEEGEPPAITIRKPDGERKITEKREHGKIKQVKVQTGKSTYILTPNEPVGSALPGDAQSGSVRPAQWQLLEFGKPKPPKEDPQPPALEPRAAEPESSKPAK